MKLIIGLGNPGGEYKDTRHNIGFMVLDKLAKELGVETLVWQEEERFKSAVTKTGGVILGKPITFMNNSGLAVVALTNFYKVSPSDVWVVHDDIDLPLGKVRIRLGGSSAGHNGVESIIKDLKTDAFVRFRLGVGRGKLFGKGVEEKDNDEKKERSSDKRRYHQSIVSFVLSRFPESDAGALKHLIKHGAEAVEIALTEGLDKAMTRFN